MNPTTLQYFSKKAFADIPTDNFVTLEELDIQDDITIPKLNLKNHFQDWLHIDYPYLIKHSNGFGRIDGNGFLFYTPAIIYQSLENPEERLNNAALMYWFFKLKDEYLDNNLNSFLKAFDDYQLFILINFLKYIADCDNDMGDDTSNIIAEIEKRFKFK